jgi:hypothetical protein
MRKPFKGSPKITSEYGARRFKLSDGTTYSDYHRGMDFAGEFNVLPIDAGKVVEVFTKGVDKGGKLVPGTPANYIVIEHLRGFKSKYFHLAKVLVKKGDIIMGNEIIGVSGRTGMTTGYHLHLELWLNGETVNPRKYIDFGEAKTLPITNQKLETIVVPKNKGWGLSNIALIAGYPNYDQSTSWQRIAELNGYDNWNALQDKFFDGSIVGTSLKVDSNLKSNIVVDSAEIKKLKAEIATLEVYKADAERVAADKYEALVLKSAELEATKKAEIDRITAEKSLEIAELESKLELAKRDLGLLNGEQIEEVIEIATDLAIEEIKSRGAKARWHEFIDTYIKSDYLRSFLKYDWFYVVMGVVGFYVYLSQQYTGDNDLVLGLISLGASIAAQVSKYVVTNHDTNKDGKIDFNDLHIVEQLQIAQSTKE